MNATPRRLGKLQESVLIAGRREAARNDIVATQQELIKVQSRLIEQQRAQHVLDQQFHTHLKTQLANKKEPRERGGTLVKSGYGAMDAAAIQAWEEAEHQKQVEEEEKALEKERKKQEREKKKADEAEAKAQRAEVAEQKRAEKAAERAEKQAEKKAKQLRKGRKQLRRRLTPKLAAVVEAGAGAGGEQLQSRQFQNHFLWKG